MPALPDTKICTACGEDKPLTDFPAGSGRHGCRAKCVACRNTWERWHLLNKKYGITKEQYYALLEAQDHACAICETDTPGGTGTWHVDHDHETKAVRGLLCSRCNLALGQFDDDTDRLRAAIAYLERV